MLIIGLSHSKFFVNELEALDREIVENICYNPNEAKNHSDRETNHSKRRNENRTRRFPFEAITQDVETNGSSEYTVEGDGCNNVENGVRVHVYIIHHQLHLCKLYWIKIIRYFCKFDN